jgi:high affinity Mn2+ porin
LLNCGRATAADSFPIRQVKAQVKAPLDSWTGFYVGSHFGYAAGTSHWSATEAGASASSLAGALDFFHACDAFKGTGSYFIGLQAGYNYLFSSRILIGAEADVSFPSRISGTQVISSALIGQASFTETAQMSGTVRGRIGYAPNHWLFYVTEGLAWTTNEFSRTQLAGMPVGGTVAPGDTQSMFLVPRFGAAAGVGVELALTPNWTARLEYLLTDYGWRSVNFETAPQRFDSNLVLHSLRLGFNYRTDRGGMVSRQLDAARRCVRSIHRP